MAEVVVSGSFDNLRTRHLRLLEEASRLGSLSVLLWSDAAVAAIEGRPPAFPIEERRYLVSSVRFVDRVVVMEDLNDRDALPRFVGNRPDVWFVDPRDCSRRKAAFCRANGLTLASAAESSLAGYPDDTGESCIGAAETGRKKVIVTGCFDWLHSGHVRFFEEVAQLGDLYVVVGHDSNIRSLKGDGHPLLGQAERRYAVGSIRFVTRALISSGQGWMDAEPEIALLKPDLYAVNEDGDRPEKREFCRRHGLEYVVLRRIPKVGLPARSSTNLRGF